MSKYLSAQERLRVPAILERRGNGELILRHATMGRVEIDGDACTGCRLCVRVCPAGALHMVDGRRAEMTGEHAGCIACADCVAICEPGAVRLSRPMTYDGLYKHIGRGDLALPRCH